MRALGTGIGTAFLGGTQFSPASLFLGGEQGAFYDPSDISSMSQDSAGTTPAAVDFPVGRILDKSGRGNHAVQATAAARPILRRDAVTGQMYLEFDGVDDCLRSPVFAIAQPWDRISAVRSITQVVNRRIFNGVVVNSGDLRQGSIANELVSTQGNTFLLLLPGVTAGVNCVITERAAGATSRVALNNAAYVTGDAGTLATDGISIAEIGTSAGVVRAGNIRLYGVVMRAGLLTEAETTQVRTFMAGKSGVTL